MGKFFLIALLAAIVWWAMKGARRAQPKPPPPIEDMVRCAQCGVHLPRSESHSSQGKYFCSAEHQRLHR